MQSWGAPLIELVLDTRLMGEKGSLEALLRCEKFDAQAWQKEDKVRAAAVVWWRRGNACGCRSVCKVDATTCEYGYGMCSVHAHKGNAGVRVWPLRCVCLVRVSSVMSLCDE